MRSPADMEVIQIEITNACLHSCSNCTRFCGHHQRPFFMDWHTFISAVDSLEGFDGIIGIMGGEPTMHPDFKRMTNYLCKQHGMSVNLKATRRPVKDFLTYTRAKHNANRVLNKCKGPGLWTSMPKQYYRHYELIQDSFLFQCLNDHHHSSFHQSLLVARKDLGIPDREWGALRDACWIQNCWSASISPKGAFFCEIAAALDMLFNGPGGWPIEPDWWLRKPGDYKDQLHWCEMCGAALDTQRRDANEKVDDVSPTLIGKLREIDSPKLKNGRVRVYALDGKKDSSILSTFQTNQYIDDFSHRLGTSNLNLLPKSITAVLYPDLSDDLDKLQEIIFSALYIFDDVALIIDTESTTFSNLEINFYKQERLKIVHLKGNTWGEGIKAAMQAFSNADWFLGVPCGKKIPDKLSINLKETFINPGVLYTFCLPVEVKSFNRSVSNLEPDMEFILFNHVAEALNKAGMENIKACNDWQQFINFWPVEKRIHLSELPENLPVTDEQEWMQVVDREFLDDKAFYSEFASKMAERVSPGDIVLVTQSASYFLTRALIRLLNRLNYTVYLLTHERFAANFRDILYSQQIVEFSHCEKIQFACLEELCSEIKTAIAFSGAVVPYSSPRRIIEPEDGYQDIEKVAVYLANRIVCGVNLKRQFVTGHKDHHSTYENRWGY